MAGLLTTNPQPTSPPARQTARTETYRLQLYRAMQATGVAIARALAAQAERRFYAGITCSTVVSSFTGGAGSWPHREIGGHLSVGPDVRARR